MRFRGSGKVVEARVRRNSAALGLAFVHQSLFSHSFYDLPVPWSRMGRRS